MKRNTLTSAVVAGITGMVGMVGVSVATESQPVHVNPDGLGQALVYPYYTAREGNDTVFSVVNTTARGKAVKVRFLEALNSREVLDFNLYLSPYDVWTAAVTLDATTGGGVMRTADASCTVPYFYGDRPAGQSYGEKEFLTFALTDGGPTGAERTASGYLELIEMGTFIEAHPYEKAITHSQTTGLPASCKTVVDAWLPLTGAWAADPSVGVGIPTGGLYGAGAIINVSDGTMFSYNATAIENLFTNQNQVVHTNPTFLEPGLGNGNNPFSATFVDGGVELENWGGGATGALYAVNATITLDSLWNEYNIDSAAGANTEWVVTFPTKAYHVDNAAKDPKKIAGSDVKPFPTLWVKDLGCITVQQEFERVGLPEGPTAKFTYWDREEKTPFNQSSGVSPPPPPAAAAKFCGEANVFRFASAGTTAPTATEILGEPQRAGSALGNFTIPLEAGYTEGHLRMDFSGFKSVESVGGTVVEGLPYVGFAVTTYTNSNVADGVLANYGGSFEHRGTRSFVNSD